MSKRSGCRKEMVNHPSHYGGAANAHAQLEIRLYAAAMLQLIRPIVPIAVSAWEAA